MQAFDDMGFSCLDGLPVALLPEMLRVMLTHPGTSKLAFALRIRSADDIKIFQKFLAQETQAHLMFLTCSTDVLVDRYISSRRRHPFGDASLGLSQAIEQEQRVLEPLRELAGSTIDTTGLSPYALKTTVEKRFDCGTLDRRLYVKITSFGFKNGVARPLDSLFDVRFLPNPYFIPDLRRKTGLDQAVLDYLLSKDEAQNLIRRLVDWHLWILPQYLEASKHYFRIGIGCTGGQHRSVVVAEELARALKEALNQSLYISTDHRDIRVF